MMKVFVYGTLMAGERNHTVVADLVADIESASLPGYDLHYYGSPNSFPFIREASAASVVIGEVLYFADADADAALARLDALESHPRFYERIETAVDVDGVEETVFVYSMPESRQRDGGKVFMNSFRHRYGSERKATV